jgi:DNA helicase II / ATP-dependent DNA helicase PcrA
MHKAKEAEFSNVFLCLEDEGDLEKHILNPNIEDEECRLRYVALSRAKERIFIYMPTLSDENRKKVESFNIKVVGETISSKL